MKRIVSCIVFLCAVLLLPWQVGASDTVAAVDESVDSGRSVPLIASPAGGNIAMQLAATSTSTPSVASRPAGKPALPLTASQIVKGPGAIVVPRESCGTHWTDWVDDPNADVNPCPSGCVRGERQILNSHKTGDKEQYQARYACYLPEMVVNQPPGALGRPGAAPRSSCGTQWTGWQSDPSADVNPCPANCVRGELQVVNRNRSDKGMRYDMRYQCYVADTDSGATSQSSQAVLGDTSPAPPPGGSPVGGPTPVTGGGVPATAAVPVSPSGTPIEQVPGINATGAAVGIDPRLKDQPAELDSRPRGESPGAVQAVATGAFAVDISWVPTACATGYEIKRSDAGAKAFRVWHSDPIVPSASCSGSQLPADRVVSTGKVMTGDLRGGTSTPATPARMSYTDTGVRHQTSYRYYVGATYTDHATGVAAGVDVTTPLPANPSSVTATADGHGGVNISWPAMPGAASYTLAGDGLRVPRTDTSIHYDIPRVAGGERSWTVVANYNTDYGTVTDTTTPARASLTAPIPPHAPGFLSKPSGGGTESQAIAHAITTCNPDEVTGPDNKSHVSCYGLKDLLTRLNVYVIPFSSEYYQVTSHSSGNSWGGYGGGDMLAAKMKGGDYYANLTDLGFGRHTVCYKVDHNSDGFSLNRSVRYTEAHGPAPGEAGFADNSVIHSVNWNDNLLSQNIIAIDGNEARFATLNAAGHRDVIARIDTEGAKRVPFVCMACHGGHYNTSTNRVEGATLLPLDPSLLAFASTRDGHEDDIRNLNVFVLDSGPSSAVTEYINGLYNGTPRQYQTRANDNYVPQGWAQYAPFYRTVIKPYCITCHLAAPARVNLMSYQNMMANASQIFNDVCKNHTMPHAELTYKHFWSDSTLPFPADQLAQALGHARCE